MPEILALGVVALVSVESEVETEQDVEPCMLSEPKGQVRQLDCPLLGWYVPALQ